MNRFNQLEEIYQAYLKHPTISKDSREIPAHCIYIALKGENFNGNKFAQQALEKGAAFAIIDEVEYKDNEHQYFLVEDVLETLQSLARLHRSKLNIPIIGITGSNGKTTSKELISTVLAKQFKTYATVGNYNNHIGVPLSILQINKEHEIAVIEMGANHQGEIAFLSGISDPGYGMITNIGKAHLEGFGGIEGVKKGKSELYKHIKNKGAKLFINGDDQVLLELAKGIEQIPYGKEDKFYCSGELTQSQPFITGSWKCQENAGLIEAQIYGDYNFNNIMAAICIGNHFGVPAIKIDKAISDYNATNNRSQLIKKEDFNILLDAYNANPSSMSLAIKDFKARKGKKQMVVLGDMFELGDESFEEHRKMIDLALELEFEELIFVGKEFYQHKSEGSNTSFFENTESALSYFANYDKKGYDILIKGSRGMALEKLLN